MKVIDLLNKIAKGEDVPEKVKVLDYSLIPEYRIITWNKTLELYKYIDGDNFDRVLDKQHLNNEIEIIEDTPVEDKKIEKLDNNIVYYGGTFETRWDDKEEILVSKLNEIIDKINGKDDEDE